MILWGGGGNVHFTWLPRKPTPMGVCMKSATCNSAGVMLRVEVMEGKVVDQKKAFLKGWGTSTGTTLRLVKPWSGSGRVIIAD